jgi:hypothetical protein
VGARGEGEGEGEGEGRESATAGSAPTKSSDGGACLGHGVGEDSDAQVVVVVVVVVGPGRRAVAKSGRKGGVNGNVDGRVECEWREREKASRLSSAKAAQCWWGLSAATVPFVDNTAGGPSPQSEVVVIRLGPIRVRTIAST